MFVHFLGSRQPKTSCYYWLWSRIGEWWDCYFGWRDILFSEHKIHIKNARARKTVWWCYPTRLLIR
jgi:hypothetical protein